MPAHNFSQLPTFNAPREIAQCFASAPPFTYGGIKFVSVCLCTFPKASHEQEETEITPGPSAFDMAHVFEHLRTNLCKTWRKVSQHLPPSPTWFSRIMVWIDFETKSEATASLLPTSQRQGGHENQSVVQLTLTLTLYHVGNLNSKTFQETHRNNDLKEDEQAGKGLAASPRIFKRPWTSSATWSVPLPSASIASNLSGTVARALKAPIQRRKRPCRLQRERPV